jgi:transcriptional regulator with XRE-family HTH domain
MAAAQRKSAKPDPMAEEPKKLRADPQRLKAFADRLNLMMQELGLPPRGRARVITDRVGVSTTTAANWLRGRSFPSYEELGRIGRLGLDPLRLMPDKTDVLPANAHATQTFSPGSQRLARLIESKQLVALTQLHTDDGQWDHSALPNSIWQALLGRDLSGLVLLRMKGDAMGERLRDGTPLLIDTKATQITDDNGVYALLLGDAVVVRRVQRRLQGGFLIASDNPALAPETIDRLGAHQDDAVKAGSVLVLGRVVMAMQKL